MWLARPIYEMLPFYYAAVGAVCLIGGVYVDYWYWSEVCLALGICGLVAGLVVWLKRRGYRSSRSRLDFEDAGR